MLRKEGFHGVLLGSLGSGRAAFPRDVSLSISRRGVPPYLPLLSFPPYATFVSVPSSFDLVLWPAVAAHLVFLVFVFVFVFVFVLIFVLVFVFVRHKQYTGRLPNLCPRNRNYALVPLSP